MFTKEEIRLISPRMSITEFDRLPKDQKMRLLEKWRKKNDLTKRPASGQGSK